MSLETTAIPEPLGRCLSRIILLAAACAWLGCAGGCVAGSGRIRSENALAVIDTSGRLTDLHGRDAPTMLSAPARLVITDSLSGKVMVASSLPASITHSGEKLTIRRAVPSLDLDIVETYELEGPLRWTVHLENRSAERREIMLDFVLTVDARDALPFFATQSDHPAWPDRGKLAYGYYRWDEGVKWILPLASLYSKGRDLGLSICPELDGPIHPDSCIIETDGDTATVTIRRRYIRLEPKGRAQRALYIASHPGDWRSALAFVRDQWPQHFFVRAPNVEQLQFHNFGGGNPFDVQDDTMPEICVLQYRTWYGEEVPDREEWYTNVHTIWWQMKQAKVLGVPDEDVGYLEIQRWLLEQDLPKGSYRRLLRPQAVGYDYSKVPPRLTRDFVNKYIDYLIEKDIVPIWYFCASEAWGAYMKEVWPGGLVYGPGIFFPPVRPTEEQLKKPVYYNWGSYVTDPDTPFGRHLIKQIEDLYKYFPRIKGLYLDQDWHAELDFSRDDGHSIIFGRPVANTAHGYDRFLERARDIVHANGGVMWFNMPGRIGDTRWSDMTQGESSALWPMRGQQYFSIGDRNALCLSPTAPVTFLDGAANRDHYPQRLLAAGFMGRWGMRRSKFGEAWAEFATGKRRKTLAYRTLTEMFRGRSWVLEPHCLELPAYAFGNVLRTRAGNFLVPVVLRDTGWATPYSRYDIPVTVRISDAARVRAVYLVSLEHLGPKKLPFKRSGREIAISIPRQRSVSMLILATTGRYVAVDAFSIPRGAAQLPLRVENWTDEPWSFRGKLSGFAAGALEAGVPAGRSVGIPPSANSWSWARASCPSTL